MRVIPPLSHRCGEAARDLFVRERCGEGYGGEGEGISLGGERDLFVREMWWKVRDSLSERYVGRCMGETSL